jgi:UrcA family protein
MTTLPSKRTPARYTLACMAAFAASTVSMTALADSSTAAVPTAAVHYKDLDLSTEQGASALYRRIVAAAREVCHNPGSRDLQQFAASEKCQAKAIEQAVNDVHSSKLAMVLAAHNARS